MKSNPRHGLIMLAAALAICLTFAAFTPALALFGGDNAAPSVAAFAKSEGAGSLVTFSQDDFVSRLRGDEQLDAIVLSALPESGALRLAGRTLGRGEAVSADALDTLCYVPADGAAEVSAHFSFLPVFSKTGAGSENVTVSINLSDTPNVAPVAQDLSYTTYAGVKLVAPLRFTDVDGDACTFQVMAQPEKGTVEITGQGFSYMPEDNKTGEDAFTYTATDALGNVSREATVSLEIAKRPAKETFQYADMTDSEAHNAALRLRDAGLFIGETIGDSHFFYPEKTVSRAEFVMMAASLAEVALPTMAVGTGLSDNADIPVWAQPYVAASVSAGLVSGESDGTGNRVFRASDAITRAEAASILNRALGLSADGRGLTCADAATVPTWAAQAVINTTYAGIVPVFGDNTVRASAAVTRADCAQMLYDASQYLAAQQSSGGFLSWLFN